MPKGRFMEEQMVPIIREADRELVAAMPKRHGGQRKQMIYTLRKRFGSFAARDVRRLRPRLRRRTRGSSW